MVWPWVVPYSSVNFGVWVPCALGTELPYSPVGAMFIIEKFDECVCRVAIGSLRIGGGGTRRSND